MTKKHFIALADMIRYANAQPGNYQLFSPPVLHYLADFCWSQNPSFKKQRWLDYIDGKCGPNGGKIETKPELL